MFKNDCGRSSFLVKYVQVIYLEVRKIYQPGYLGGRGERQKIYLARECELSSVAGILCVTVRPERTPQENLSYPAGPLLFLGVLG